MSVRVMSLVWDSTVRAPERFTLLALADRADEDGICWPSVPTLARKCRTGESTIRRHLKALAGLGVLRVKHRSNDSSVYQIVLSQLRQLVDAEEQRDPSQSDSPSQSDRGRRGRKSSRPNPCQIDTPSQSGRGAQSDSPSQIEQSTPPNLSSDPSQIGRQYISDPSVDPSGTTAPRASRTAPGAQLAIVQPTKVAIANVNQGHLVAAWVEGFTEAHDAEPTSRQKGQAARECGALLRAGNPPERVLAAARSAGQRGFATVEREYADLSSRRGAGPSRPRQSTTDARVKAAADLASQYPEESA